METGSSSKKIYHKLFPGFFTAGMLKEADFAPATMKPEKIAERLAELEKLDNEMVQYFNGDSHTIWSCPEAATFFEWVFEAVKYQGMNPKDILKAVASQESNNNKFNSEISILIGAFLDRGTSIVDKPKNIKESFLS